MHLYIVDIYNPNGEITGGRATYTRNLINYCKKNNIKFTLIGVGEYQKNEFKFFSISKKKIGFFSFIFNLILKTNKLKLEENGIILAQRIDMLIPFLFKKNLTKISLAHGNMGLQILRRGKLLSYVLFRIIEKICLLKTDLLITVCKRDKNYYRKRYGKKLKIRTIPVGVNITNIKNEIQKPFCDLITTNHDNNILFVGRLKNKIKNVQLIIDAFTKLNKKNYNLYIIGDGPDRKWLENYANKYNLDDKIKFLGVIKPPKLYTYYKNSNLLVLTSELEGSPTVVKEALATNTPVVSTDVGDVKEVLKDCKGCYITENHTDDLVRKIEIALANNDKNYDEIIRKYDVNTIFKELIYQLERTAKAD